MFTLSNLRTLSIEELRNQHNDKVAEKAWLVSQIYRKHNTKKKQDRYTHPTYEIMVTKAIRDLKQRKGSSRSAIKKYILSNYVVNEKTFNSQFRLQIRNLIDKGVLYQPGGHSNSPLKVNKGAAAQSARDLRGDQD